MGSRNFTRDLLAMSGPELVIQLTGNQREMEAIKSEMRDSRHLCENMIEVLSKIEPLSLISPSAKTILSDFFDPQTESVILDHFQTLLLSSANCIKRENLSKTIERYLKLRQNFDSKSDPRFSVVLESVVRELETKFSLEFTNHRENPVTSSISFREEPIISIENLKTQKLKKNVIKGSYGSVENYLEIHFRLLREDFLAPLREGLDKINSGQDSDLISYGNVDLDQLKVNYDKIAATFRLCDVSSLYFDFESSQKLMNGSLVVLVTEKCHIFGTVTDKMSQRGMVEVTFLNRDDFLNVASHFLANNSSLSRLYESPVYFEAYRHVLSCLQQTTDIPFADNLIEGKSNVLPPNFLTDKIDWDISSLFEKRASTKLQHKLLSSEEVFKNLMSRESKLDAPPGPPRTTRDIVGIESEVGHVVNPSQLEAVKLALSKRVALIQGPPGTGKSYVGQILVRFMLSNREKLWPDVRTRRPILVVCFTNRALDSFLESTLLVTKNVVRIGSRSKSEFLESHNLSSIKKWSKDASMRDGTLHKLEKSLEKELFECREEMNELCNNVNSLLSEKTIKNFDQNMIDRWQAAFERFDKISTRLEDVRHLESASLAQRADVVGMTTSGAAKYRHFVRMLDCRVVIVEEAGQVLESHVLTALSPNCQQLILIGDHQQLRPAVSTYRPGQTHGLDISLFERLVTNGISYARLKEQHRMRPDISRIVSRVFYPELKDHASVLARPPVRGTAKNVFLVSHQCSEESFGGKSKVNVLESSFLLRLAQHLVRVGNSPHKMTLLTAYTGQMLHMIKLRDEIYPELSKILITVVDNYQGEENDLILLSLVRSNEEGKIGFLNIAGRVCVALSRAKAGLFIVGNVVELSRRSTIWSTIQNVLESDNSVGTSIELVCPFHSTSRRFMSPTDDVTLQNDSKYFCDAICDEVLSPCGHKCPHPCHIKDRNHVEHYKCTQPCRRSCAEGHPCRRMCIELCAPCEWTDSTKTILKCGHEKTTKCATIYDMSECQMPIIKKLSCGHEKMSTCSSKSTECDFQCDVTLKCGHKCDIVCGEHNEERHNARCVYPCRKPKLGCSKPDYHPLCNKLCHQICDLCTVPVDVHLPCGHTETGLACFTDPSNFECSKKCGKTLPGCGHTCKSFCHECRQGCQACPISVIRSLPCSHEVKMVCGSNPEEVKCEEKCLRNLACGHPCLDLCWERCGDSSQCQVLVKTSNDVTSCGHAALFPCHLRSREESESSTSSACHEICGKVIEACGHKCNSKCSECSSGLVHLPCTSKCERLLICGHACESSCGVPCQPCTKRKCLFQPCHHIKCKSKCEDPCTTPCKEKCGLGGCDHSGGLCLKKCGQACGRPLPCPQDCPKLLSCGHKCPSYCGDLCPSADFCPSCLKPDSVSDHKLLALSCGHVISEPDLKLIFDSSEIGIPLCRKCQEPIQFMWRYRKEMKSRKSKVLEVFDKYFALKSNISQAKKDLLDKLEGDKKLDPGFKAHLINRCQDRSNQMTLAEFQNISTKLILLNLLATHGHEENWTKMSKEFLLKRTSIVGHRYVEDILNLMSRKDHLDNVDNFVCFSIRSWSSCSNGHLFPSAFKSFSCFTCSNSKQ